MDPGSILPIVDTRAMVVRITFHPDIRGSNSITVGIVDLHHQVVNILDPHLKAWVLLVLKVRGRNTTLPQGREALHSIHSK